MWGEWNLWRTRSWPPKDGAKFIRSESFGRMLVEIVEQLTKDNPHRDFTDAVAHLFAWFDRKLSENRHFINRRRFRTEGAFKAYLRQAAWNAARLAERQRRRHRAITALPIDHPITEREMSPVERADLLDRVERLNDPHKTVLWRLFFEEAEPWMIAAALDISEEQLCRLYEEAIDLLGIR
jgi:hypothetical protein